ncbi:MAG TPA: IS4 family transposase [Terriglobia bacterium]|nr:IS4 family transposase [Terriglobia bacterium]
MARTIAELPKGSRITDYISLGVLTTRLPLSQVKSVLQAQSKASRRQRDLPAHVVVYYVICLALFMQVSYGEVLRCLLEGLTWLLGPRASVKVTGKSGISQARTRLGWEVMRQLHEEVVKPLAGEATRGAWYRGWRLVSLDGSTLSVADEQENAQAFGRPSGGRGEGAYPQLRFVSLVENGTHVLFGTHLGSYATGEITLAEKVIAGLRKGMLCLADRGFFSYALWNRARATGADLLWRVKKDVRLTVEQLLPDGSYLSRIYPSARAPQSEGVGVRVIQYRLEGVADAEPAYRLVTTILDPAAAPTEELAALYHERWEIEGAFDELKTHLRGAKIVLRSKTPDLVRQEFYGLLLAHFALRGLMHEAALKAGEDPDRISFVHTVRVIRRKLPLYGAIPPSASKTVP